MYQYYMKELQKVRPYNTKSSGEVPVRYSSKFRLYEIKKPAKKNMKIQKKSRDQDLSNADSAFLIGSELRPQWCFKDEKDKNVYVKQSLNRPHAEMDGLN